MSKGKHAKEKKYRINKSKILRLIFLIAVVSIIVIVFNTKKEQNETHNLLNNIEVSQTGNQEQQVTEKILQIQELKKQYKDVIGWLEVPGTNIDYPVMQGTDNNYYVKHNYKQEYDYNGSIFLHKDYDWSIPSSNLLIYGHNNKNDCMFAQLLKYKEESFYKEHPVIKFITTEEEAEYEIIAVFLSRIYYKTEDNVFRYYKFINAENETQYNEYVKNSKKESLYNINATAKYGEQLITLTTCEYSQQDGRFVVVGRKK